MVDALSDLARLLDRIDAYRQAGDTKTALALLREVHALRDRLGRLEAGVRVAMGRRDEHSLCRLFRPNHARRDPGRATVNGQPPQVQAAIHANPALPADDLISLCIAALPDALRNPSLPLVLLNGGTYEVGGVGHMEDGETTPTAAVGGACGCTSPGLSDTHRARSSTTCARGCSLLSSAPLAGGKIPGTCLLT